MTHVKSLLAASFFIVVSLSLRAQVSSDSINALKQQKQSLEISSRINERKLQLAKLENSIEQKTKSMEGTAADAQKAADENNAAAAALTADPQDKKLARRAKKAARSAERSARKARTANSDLDDLRKDIDSLKSKIAEDENKLATISSSN